MDAQKRRWVPDIGKKVRRGSSQARSGRRDGSEIERDRGRLIAETPGLTKGRDVTAVMQGNSAAPHAVASGYRWFRPDIPGL